VTVGPAGLAYREVRTRIAELVAEAASSDAAVPSCPEWRVHDVVAHCAGVVDDFLSGNLESAGSPAWTAVQVDARRTASTASVLSTWAEQAPQLEEQLDGFGPAGYQLLMDVATHELDLREALGIDPAEAASSAAVSLGLGWLLERMTLSAGRRGLPGLRLRSTDGREWVPDDDRPVVATLTGSPLELLRACSGRRSEAQLRAMEWEGDVDAALPAFTWGPFAMPAPAT
jgi:uncharacterized protein (TIGR03083 family)